MVFSLSFCWGGEGEKGMREFVDVERCGVIYGLRV